MKKNANLIFSAYLLSIPVLNAKTANYPNVIFILADDLGWADLSCNGSKFYETPNIDKLALEGISFNNAYASSPVSSPSRVSYLTGKYPARLNITDYIPGSYFKHKKQIDTYCPVIPPAFQQNLPLSEVTIAEALKEANYQTAHIGKWNCSEDSLFFPQYQGFDINIAGCNKGGPGKDGYFSPYHNPYLKDGPQGEYLTDRLANECINTIRKFQGRPFFISISFYQVHTPLLAPQCKVNYFINKARRMGLDTMQTFKKETECQGKLPYKSKSLRERIIQSNTIYAAMISSMDENIGKIICELKRQGLYNNTLIIFTSDNGGLSTSEGSPTSNYPLRGGKGHVYEGGIRVPLIVKWNSLRKKGVISSEPVIGTDFYPTILDLLDLSLKPMQHMDGVSFASVLRGKRRPSRYPLYWHFPHYSNQGGRPASVIRLNEYKLIEFLDTGELELYNIEKDISERNNLAKTMPVLKNKLLKKLHTWQKSIPTAMPSNNLYLHKH